MITFVISIYYYRLSCLSTQLSSSSTSFTKILIIIFFLNKRNLVFYNIKRKIYYNEIKPVSEQSL